MDEATCDRIFSQYLHSLHLLPTMQAYLTSHLHQHPYMRCLHANADVPDSRGAPSLEGQGARSGNCARSVAVCFYGVTRSLKQHTYLSIQRYLLAPILHQVCHFSRHRAKSATKIRFFLKHSAQGYVCTNARIALSRTCPSSWASSNPCDM